MCLSFHLVMVLLKFVFAIGVYTQTIYICAHAVTLHRAVCIFPHPETSPQRGFWAVAGAAPSNGTGCSWLCVRLGDALNLGFAVTIKYRPCIARKSTSSMTPDIDLFDWTVGKRFSIICGASSILKPVIISVKMIYCFLSLKSFGFEGASDIA